MKEDTNTSIPGVSGSSMSSDDAASRFNRLESLHLGDAESLARPLSCVFSWLQILQ